MRCHISRPRKWPFGSWKSQGILFSKICKNSGHGLCTNSRLLVPMNVFIKLKIITISKSAKFQFQWKVRMDKSVKLKFSKNIIFTVCEIRDKNTKIYLESSLCHPLRTWFYVFWFVWPYAVVIETRISRFYDK